jgi:RNA polymerase sigma factor (sigma-70 family)
MQWRELIHSGDQKAFERAYEQCHQQVRLMAWRVSHRPDWVDDLVNEVWCRAFRLRTGYDPQTPFLVWVGGILQNVYREFCRGSRGGTSESGMDVLVDETNPERIAAEAELLAGLDDCVKRLAPTDAELIRLRFYQERPLREIAQAVGIPESTLREVRLPAAFRALRRCLEHKNIRFSELFPAQDGPERQ